MYNVQAVRVSLATLLYNYSVYFKQSPPSGTASEAKLQVLSALMELLAGAPLEDIDSVFRGLVALGTLCHEDAEMRALAVDMGANDVLRRVNDSPEARKPEGRRLLEAALDVMAIVK